MNLFEGIKVLELTTTIAAPAAGKMFGDWGADVIKVEPPTNDSWRNFFPTSFNVKFNADDNPVYDLYNSNKKNICIDLKTAEGMEVFHKLLSQADIFITNNRTSALVKMGIDYDTLHAKYPSLIYGNINGYGEFGAEAVNPGYDTASFWARSGLTADLTPKGADPIMIAGGIGDSTTGMGLFAELCAALFHRQRTGEGEYVSNSLYGSGLWAGSMMITMTEEPYGNKWPKPRNLGNPANGNYWTKDNEMVNITIVDWPRYFPAVCEALGHPEITEKYSSYKLMMDNRTEVFPLVEAMFKDWTADEILEKLRPIGVTISRMKHWWEQPNDPQALANGYVAPMKSNDGHDMVRVNPPVYIKDHPTVETKNAAKNGENTVEILKSLGYDDASIEAMLQSKAVIQHA